MGPGRDDVEVFIGGEVARRPDFRLRLHELRRPVLILARRYHRELAVAALTVPVDP